MNAQYAVQLLMLIGIIVFVAVIAYQTGVINTMEKYGIEEDDE